MMTLSHNIAIHHLVEPSIVSFRDGRQRVVHAFSPEVDAPVNDGLAVSVIAQPIDKVLPISDPFVLVQELDRGEVERDVRDSPFGRDGIDKASPVPNRLLNVALVYVDRPGVLVTHRPKDVNSGSCPCFSESFPNGTIVPVKLVALLTIGNLPSESVRGISRTFVYPRSSKNGPTPLGFITGIVSRSSHVPAL